MTTLPGWMHPPRPQGWFSDDLDHVAELPPHTELFDGALVFRLLPQHRWHSRVVHSLTTALTDQAPPPVEVTRRTTVRLDDRTRVEPDIMATIARSSPDRTVFPPTDVVLAVEVASPESAYRDRTVKLRKYGEAGIPNYWLVDQETRGIVVHTYQLDEPTAAYTPTGIFRDRLERPVPFAVSIDLPSLLTR